jgi:hypothetical protein
LAVGVGVAGERLENGIDHFAALLIKGVGVVHTSLE